MDWLQTLDIDLFRCLNQALVNPVCDAVMPFVSGNALFRPLLLVGGIILIWRTRTRGLLCVLMLAIILPLGDGFVCNTLKHAVGRPRPFVVLPDVHRPDRKPQPPKVSPAPATEAPKPAMPSEARGDYSSLPSSHAANWFAATMIAFIYFRRSLWFMLPAALLVGFARIYNGAHYPSDVLAGAILGGGYGAAGVLSLNALWNWAGRKWFPLWWARFPSLVHPPQPSETDEGEEAPFPIRPTATGARTGAAAPHATLDQHWLRLGYIWIALLLLIRLIYIASGTIELSRDEAYQWLWSKHLALSYYSKPPLIAYTQFLGTLLWGDNAFGVRFFAPVIGAVLGALMLRFFARYVNARAGFFLQLIVFATPLLSTGAVLMTIDPLSVLFWTAAMLAGWRAVQDDATTRSWLWVGLWMGFGFLSKYTELFQLLCWAVFFILWPPARKQLRRPGPYLALLLNLVLALPVLIWNYQHHWITVAHVAGNAGLTSAWKPTARYLLEFLGAEAGLLNPVFFIATVWAAIAFWRGGRHDPRLVYFLSMGAPLFLCYMLYAVRSRILPNWIAPSVLPLFAFMVIYWDTRWRLGAASIKPWLITGLTLGSIAVVIAHNTELVTKLTGWRPPLNMDVLHRARGWSDVAKIAAKAREELIAEGKPVFIIGDHYSLVGEVSFYMPEAKAVAATDPIVFYRTDSRAVNQFYFWPGYESRKGQNAIFIRELDRNNPIRRPIPREVEQEFESVEELGVQNVLDRKRVLWPIQVFACRGLR